jgi:hypothetical protein
VLDHALLQEGATEPFAKPMVVTDLDLATLNTVARYRDVRMSAVVSRSCSSSPSACGFKGSGWPA